MNTAATPSLSPLPCPLYPEIEPFATHMLDVGDGHSLYVEESGNPHGLPVVALHGGPGSGCTPTHRRRFDPAVYRIICFDQRGAGRSVQADGDILRANTTAHLVADMEKIRTTLSLESWVLYGTSWGSTLALVYAEAHPERVQGLLVGGIFLANAETFDWFTHPMGLRQFLPTFYEQARATLAAGEGEDLNKAVGRSLEARTDATATMVHALAFYEAMAATPAPHAPSVEAYLSTEPAQRGALIQCSYYAYSCFLEDDQIMQRIDTIRHIPTFIFHGHVDFVCTPKHAYRLHQALPYSTLTIVPTCGHLGSDAMDAVRVQASDKMACLLGQRG